MFTFFILLVLVTSNGPFQGATGDVSGVSDGETSFYHGTINQTLEVELTLTRKGNTITGTYEYAAHQQPINLQGTLLPDGSMKISEFAGGGIRGGQFLLNNLLGQGHLDGKWNSPVSFAERIFLPLTVICPNRGERTVGTSCPPRQAPHRTLRAG